MLGQAAKRSRASARLRFIDQTGEYSTGGSGEYSAGGDTVADHRHQRRGRGLPDAPQAHQLLRLVVLPRHLGDVPVVGLDALVQAVDLAELSTPEQISPFPPE